MVSVSFFSDGNNVGQKRPLSVEVAGAFPLVTPPVIRSARSLRRGKKARGSVTFN